ncbi:hypothetical protein [Bradyrhizobium sp. ORS 86]|uniref:hypothetical protein n=1 Tax=Bradyrhizobium sp. ORS 86 TaxID=1685970 RepID=UPI00388D08E7
MIRDHTIDSARAGKHTNRIFRNLMTALLASVLTLPSLAAWGMESSPQQAATKPGGTLTLPPIRYLDATPWMKWNASTPTMRIDTLVSPSVTPWGVLQIPQNRAKASPNFS